MTDKIINVKLTGDNSGLVNALRGSGAQLQGFGANVKGAALTANRYLTAISQNFGTVGTAITALSTGVVLKKLFSLGDFIPLDKAMLLMAANFRMSEKELGSFKTQLASFAGSAGEDITGVFQSATKLSRMYKPEEVLQLLAASSDVAHVTGASLEDSASRVTQIMKMYHRAPGEAKRIADSIITSRADVEVLDTLLQRGVLKGATGEDYKDFLAVIGGLNKMGLTGPRVINSVMGAFSSMIEKAAEFKAIGLDLFEADPITGQKVKKSPIEILQELDALRKSKYKNLSDDEIAGNLNKALGGDSGNAIMFMLENMDKLKKGKEDQVNAAEKAAAQLAAIDKTWAEDLERIHAAVASIKLEYTEMYDQGKKAVHFMVERPGLTKGVVGATAATSVAIGGALLYKKGMGFLGGIRSTAVGLAEGKAIEAATGVTPVFVTNMPPGGILPSLLPTAVITAVEGGAAAAAGAAVGLVTGATMFAAREGGKAFAEYQSRTFSTDHLEKMRGEEEVMGGGRGSYKYQLMDAELRGRNAKGDYGSAINVKPTIPITINMQDGRTTVVTPGMDSDVSVNRGRF